MALAGHDLSKNASSSEHASLDRMPVAMELRRTREQYHVLGWNRPGELCWGPLERRDINRLELYVDILDVGLAGSIAPVASL